MFILILSFAFAGDDYGNSTFNPEHEDLNVSGTFEIAYTNTIKFEVTETKVKTINAKGQETYTKSFIAVYTPTILKILRLVDIIKSTKQALTPTPTATAEFKNIFFKPGLCVGATFAVLFIICACYTSVCRRPYSVARQPRNPKAKGKKQKKVRGRRNSVSDDSVESFSGANVRRGSVGTPSEHRERGNSTRGNPPRQTRARSGTTAVHSINDNQEFL